MQWYLASLAMLFIMVGVGILTGALVIACLPARMLPGARIFLSVPLGWALLTLVATLPGWIGTGYIRCHCTEITLLLAAAGAWVGRHWLRHAGGDCLRLGAFCALASFPVLGPLWHHGSFSLTNNDTFIYTCQAQWLQHHAFILTPRIAGGYPAWSQVASFQVSSLRMGASFLLGWTQAAFGLEWSLDLYPAMAALALICGALGVGAMVLAACPGRWAEAWLAALATAGTLNGFAFGAGAGFFPQTWGLAFASAAFGLRGLETGTHAERAGRGPWRTGVPLGITVAASMHCYWDLLPLEGPALALTYLYPWPGRDARAWRGVWRWAGAPVLVAVLLVNLEWIRAVRGILQNLTAVVGGPVAWTVPSFPAHALGLRASVWEGGGWINGQPSRVKLIGGTVVVVLWLAALAASQGPARWRHWRRTPRRLARWHGPALIPALTWLGLSTLLFVYFRYHVPSPWHGHFYDPRWIDGVGQSWSQYKVTIWASCFVIAIVAALGTGATLRRAWGGWRVAWLAILTLWCGTGLGWNRHLIQDRGSTLLYLTGLQRDPLEACRAMEREIARLPPNDWVYLDWPPDRYSYGFRALMVYFLCNRPVASDWHDDIIFPGYIPPEDANRTPADCAWILKYRLPKSDGSAPAMGGMTLEKSPGRVIQ